MKAFRLYVYTALPNGERADEVVKFFTTREKALAYKDRLFTTSTYNSSLISNFELEEIEIL